MHLNNSLRAFKSIYIYVFIKAITLLLNIKGKINKSYSKQKILFFMMHGCMNVNCSCLINQEYTILLKYKCQRPLKNEFKYCILYVNYN